MSFESYIDSNTLVCDEDRKRILTNPPIEHKFDERGAGWEFFNTFKKHKNNIAQIDTSTDEKQTYEQLLKRCIRTAMSMKKQGITEEDIITLCTENSLDAVVPFFAALFLGCKISSLHTKLAQEEATFLLAKIKPRMVFVSTNCTEMIEQALRNIESDAIIVEMDERKHLSFEDFVKPQEEEDLFEPYSGRTLKDVAIIFFSSGTTGLPKGICHSHYSLLCAGELKKAGFDTSSYLSYSAFYWIASVFSMAAILLNGGYRVVTVTFDPVKFWFWVDKYKVTLHFMSLYFSVATAEAGRPENVDTSSLKVIFLGGAKIPTDVIKKLKELLPETRVDMSYGQTEILSIISCFMPNPGSDLRLSDNKMNSSGTVYPGLNIKVVDIDTNKTLGPNEEGEIRLLSEKCMLGYWKQDSKEAFDESGWLKTGDVGYYDEDGYIYVVDRVKELIKFRGNHVAPASIEVLLSKHPAVKTSTVIGIPHKSDGEHPTAVIVLNKGFDESIAQDIVNYVNAQVPDYKQLRGGVKFIEVMPYSATGKVDRRSLKKLFGIKKQFYK